MEHPLPFMTENEQASWESTIFYVLVNILGRPGGNSDKHSVKFTWDNRSHCRSSLKGSTRRGGFKMVGRGEACGLGLCTRLQRPSENQPGPDPNRTLPGPACVHFRPTAQIGSLYPEYRGVRIGRTSSSERQTLAGVTSERGSFSRRCV